MQKEMVINLVKDKNIVQLINLLHENSKQLARYLVRLTYANDHLLRMQAIECLGKVAAVQSDSQPEEIRNLIRRFVWSMNDESGTVSWSAPQIIAEIIYHRPELYGEFGSVMINASWDEETFQQGMLWAIGRLSGKISYIEDISEKITEFLSHSKPEIRGYAIWTLGEIKCAQAVEKISSFLNAKEKIEIYINGEMVQKTIGELAKESLDKIAKKEQAQ